MISANKILSLIKKDFPKQRFLYSQANFNKDKKGYNFYQIQYSKRFHPPNFIQTRLYPLNHEKSKLSKGCKDHWQQMCQLRKFCIFATLYIDNIATTSHNIFSENYIKHNLLIFSLRLSLLACRVSNFLQHNPSKHSSWWRRLKDVLKTSFVFVFRRRLEDVLKTFWSRRVCSP